MTTEIFRCCRADDAPHGFVPTPASAASGTLGRSVGVVELAATPRRETCLHEGAHAVAAFAFGVPVIGLRVAGQGVVNFGGPMTALVDAVVALAGPIGELWGRRHSHASPDAIVASYGDRSRFGGGCDWCLACRALRRAVPDLADRDLPAFFRQIEAVTLDLLRRPPVWRAVSEVADAAMQRHTLLGDEIEAVVAKDFRPGSFRLELHGKNIQLVEELP